MKTCVSIPKNSLDIVECLAAVSTSSRQTDGFQSQDTLYECPLESIKVVGTRDNVTGMAVREYFAKYFTSPLGSVPGQYEKV